MSQQLSPQPPLMPPIEYNGQAYYTSQYFHAHYAAQQDMQAWLAYVRGLIFHEGI